MSSPWKEIIKHLEKAADEVEEASRQCQCGHGRGTSVEDTLALQQESLRMIDVLNRWKKKAEASI